jgi:hypothetical protein
MATAIDSPSSNTQMTALSHKSELLISKYLITELRRLSSFQSLKEILHPSLCKGLLAKLGLYYSKIENKIKCEACDFEIDSSLLNINILDLHMEKNPECQFVLNHRNLCPKTGIV